jgi:hypothetical protein
MRSKEQKIYWLSLLCCLGTTLAWGQRGQVEIARDGQAQAVIVVPAGWTNAAVLPEGLPRQAADQLNKRRTLFRESVKDLAHYLGKMSGSEIEIVEVLAKDDKRTPIAIGSAAEAVFGPVGISKAGLFGFRVVVDHRRGIGLYGESQVGTSYAIYELLHRLGCRWYMPMDIGEVVPDRPRLSVAAMDLKLAPATESRGMWHGGDDFLRRNRLGEYGREVWLSRGDGSFERFFDAKDLQANPEWRALQADGKPHSWALRATHPGVAAYVADKIIKQLDTIYEPMQQAGLRPAYQITPGDGQVPTEDPVERPHDPDPRVWEPAAGRWSVTDRCMVLIGRIAETVRAKYPDVHFADYAYVNKSYPPARHPVPEDFQIVMAPIDFNRHHPMTWPDHPNEFWLRDMVEGWGKTGAKLGAYWYGINLAEISAPCPFITKWGTDIRILLENNLQHWNPETMNGWDSMLPGYYIAIRMTFYPEETPETILADLWENFYGASAVPMARYWTGIDQAYLEARQYAGSPYGYLRIFTPEVMKAARADLDEALSLARTADVYRRVLLIDESFGLFEWYMKMRNDWAEGKLADLEADYTVWRHGIRSMQRKYGVIGRFARDANTSWGLCHVQGRHGNPAWSDSMYSVGYKEGSRMEREYTRFGRPMLEWKWQHNPILEFDEVVWAATDFNDSAWPLTHVVRDTWSSLGHHLTMTDAAGGRSGRMAYRVSHKLPAVPEGKKVFLWIGSTDGSARVFVNGTHIPYVTPDKGETRDAFNGYCRASGTGFDVTAALKAGDNQFTILCDRHHLNELGTGGLMGPVVLYREK